MSAAARPSASRLALLAALLGGVLLILAWHDVVPGGWRLRTLVVPHHVREAWRQARHAAERLALFAEENPALPDAAVLFLGSSTIERFPLERLFPGVPTANRGIGNETATELLARLDASLPASTPAAAVLYAGSLDFRREERSPEVTARRVERVVLRLREHFPGLPIALIGLLPEWDFPAPRVVALAATNRALADLAAARDLAFVPTDRPPITDPHGALARAASADRLHLGEVGYRALAGWLLQEGGAAGRALAP